MSGNIENGREYLLHVMECLKKRLAETDAAILEGEKEIEDMHVLRNSRLPKRSIPSSRDFLTILFPVIEATQSISKWQLPFIVILLFSQMAK